MKKFTKTTALICVLAMSLNLCACGKAADTAESVEAQASVAAETTEEEALDSIPNPMVEVTDAKEYEEKLGIAIDPTYLVGDVTMYLIADTLAELTYEVTNIDNEPVTCTLRAAKPDSLTSDISGVYADMTETTEEYSADTTITVTHKSAAADAASPAYEIYEFEYNGNSYCFMYTGGDLSAMMLGELLDGVFCAIGAETVSN